MDRRPRISIVTAVLEPERDIGGTVESVQAQDYPALEHIIVAGRPTEGRLETLRRHATLLIASEKARRHADALNEGVRLATGDILAFMDPDDTLLPGALRRVAEAIDPGRGRHVVMGRCRLVDADGRFTGIEHPSRFEGHRRVLEVWTGPSIPRPAVFWTAEAWRACGPVDERLRAACAEYDLFCRMSRRYRFHVIDAVLAASRLHAESSAGRTGAAGRLEESIRISRRYWGSPLRPLYWQLAVSLARHRLDRAARARRWLGEARARWDRGERLAALPGAVGGALLGPDVAFYVAVYPRLRDRSRSVGRRALDRLARAAGPSPQTAAYLDRTEVWDDGWVGPRLIVCREAAPDARAVRVRGIVQLEPMRGPFVLAVSVDDREIGRRRLAEAGAFELELPLGQPLGPGAHRIGIRASAWFVPDRLFRNGDHRPLSWRLGDVEVA